MRETGSGSPYVPDGALVAGWEQNLSLARQPVALVNNSYAQQEKLQ
jgi:hypothetical protein